MTAAPIIGKTHRGLAVYPPTHPAYKHPEQAHAVGADTCTLAKRPTFTIEPSTTKRPAARLTAFAASTGQTASMAHERDPGTPARGRFRSTLQSFGRELTILIGFLSHEGAPNARCTRSFPNATFWASAAARRPLVKTLGIEGIDKFQVSRISRELDVRVEEFRNRPLDGSPYRYVWVDALYIKVREGGRTISAAVGVAAAVNNEGRREVIGMDIFNTEDGASWIAFFRNLVARSIGGVEPVVLDCHLGLKAAIEAVVPGAAWQRCRTHMVRNVLTHAPKHAQDMVATCCRTIFAQPDAAAVCAQFGGVIVQLEAPSLPRPRTFLPRQKMTCWPFALFPDSTGAKFGPTIPKND